MKALRRKLETFIRKIDNSHKDPAPNCPTNLVAVGNVVVL